MRLSETRPFDSPPGGAILAPALEAPAAASPLPQEGAIFLREEPEQPAWGEAITVDLSERTDTCDDAITLYQSDSGYQAKVSLVDVSSINPKIVEDEVSHYEVVIRGYGRSLGFDPMRSTQSLSLEVSMDRDYEPQGPPSVIIDNVTPSMKLNYPEAQTLVREGNEKYGRLLQEWEKVALALNAQRRARGDMTSIINLERGRVVTGEGRIQERPLTDVVPAIIIQEAMTAVNNELAKIMGEARIPLLYRNQKGESGNQETLLDAFERAVSDPDDSEALEEIRHGLSPVYLSPYPEGHYAAGTRFSAKFSSPLTKFRDFVNMQQALAFLTGRPLPYSVDQLVEIAKRKNRPIDSVYELDDHRFGRIVRAAVETNRLREVGHEIRRRHQRGELDTDGLTKILGPVRMQELLAS